MADVSAAMSAWSATSSSNNPSGSTNVGTGLDDNLREIQGSVVRNLHNKGNDIASAGTTDLGAVEGLFHDITGTTTITSFGTVRAGVWKVIKFEGALTLTHNATSLILPGGANITTADGDTALMVSEGSGNWRCEMYVKKSGATLATKPTITTYTSGSGTYTVPTGATYIEVECWGGGGSGGGGDGTNRGTGGGGGGYVKKLYTTPSATYAYAVGAAGAAAAQGNNGNAGGATTFGSLTASGGGAGAVATGSGLGGSAGGAASGGDENLSGEESGPLNGGTPASDVSGGGNSPRGGMGGKSNVSSSGAAPGGGGACANGTGNSGAGAAGRIVIHEYYL